MKQLFVRVLVVVLLAGIISSCTDENVKPQTNEGGGQGGAYDPKG